MSSSQQDQSEAREESTPFKTITHEPPTRHPTSNKKKQHNSPFHRTNPQYSLPKHYTPRPPSLPSRSQELRYSLSDLQIKKYQCLQAGRYKQASNIEKQITRTRSQLSRSEMRRIQRNSHQEKRSIRMAYINQLSYFESAWNNYFQRFKELQRKKIQQFKKQEAIEVERARDKLRKKCNSLRHASRQILQLEKAEQYHLRKGNLFELVQTRRQKKRKIMNTKKQRKELIDKWTHMEGEKLSTIQSKKYSILQARLQERRQDQQKAFMMEKKRLKQKYNNVLCQLRHQQRMTLQFVSRCSILDQSD